MKTLIIIILILMILSSCGTGYPDSKIVSLQKTNSEDFPRIYTKFKYEPGTGAETAPTRNGIAYLCIGDLVYFKVVNAQYEHLQPMVGIYQGNTSYVHCNEISNWDQELK